MKKIYLAVFVVLCIIGYAVISEGALYESITVSNTAIGPSAYIIPQLASTPSYVFCTTETNDIRIRYDGTVPTASEGHKVVAGSSFSIKGQVNVYNLKMIRTSADATVKCSYE